jgi:hypothetical protein
MAARHSDTLTIRCPPGLNALIERAADAQGTSCSEWIRQALRTGLQLAGFDPAAIRPVATETNPAALQSQQTASEVA